MLFNWIIFLAYTVLVYQTAVLPPNRIPKFWLHVNDKLSHGLQYFLLFWAAWNAFRKIQKWNPRAAAGALFYCAVLGILTEFSQLHVPGRQADLKDWLADMAGAVLGLLLLKFLASSRRKA